MPSKKSSTAKPEKPVHPRRIYAKDLIEEGHQHARMADCVLQHLRLAMLPLPNGKGYDLSVSSGPEAARVLGIMMAGGTFTAYETGDRPTPEMAPDIWLAYNTLAEVLGLTPRKLQIEWGRLFKGKRRERGDKFEAWKDHLGEIALRALQRKGVLPRVEKVLESWPWRESLRGQSAKTLVARPGPTDRESAEAASKRKIDAQGDSRAGKPSEHDFRAFYLHETRGRTEFVQKKIAGIIKKEYGLSAGYDQSRVSKACTKVRAWLDGGKTFPATFRKRWDSLPAPWEQVPAGR